MLAGGRVPGVWQPDGDELRVRVSSEASPVPAEALAAETRQVGAPLAHGLTLAVERR